MNFRQMIATGAVVFSAAMAGSAQAGILFQSVPDLAAVPDVNAYCSTCFGDPNFQVYDTFTLGNSATVRGIQFAVQSDYFFPTDVTVGIYGVDGSGLPSANLFSQTFTPAQFASETNTVNDTTIVGVNPSGLSLAAGTYDISFYNTVNLGVPAYPGGSGLLYVAPGDELGFVGDSAAFSLSDSSISAVPLPASLPLLGAAVAGLAGFGMRRARRQVR